MTPSGLDHLRHALDALASEVEQVDLRDRVHATARRLALRRATAASACVAVLVGATAVTTARVFASAESDRSLPGTAENSASCAVGDPRGSWRDPGEWATLTPEPSIDELFYVAPTSQGGRLPLVSWHPGMAEPVARCALPVESGTSVNVSPDGKWVTWVSADGALHIADLAGSANDRILRRDVDGDTLAPAWSPDARQLIVRDATAVVGAVDVATGRFTPLRHNLPDVRHLVWAADGTAIAFVTTGGKVIVAKPDGSQQRAVPGLDRVTKAGRRIVGVQSLSGPMANDGSRYLTITAHDPKTGSPPERPLVSNAMINTKDGRETGAVGGVGEYAGFQAFFRDERGQGSFSHLLRRVDRNRGVELIGGNGEYWGGGGEPPSLAGYLLLGA